MSTSVSMFGGLHCPKSSKQVATELDSNKIITFPVLGKSIRVGNRLGQWMEAHGRGIKSGSQQHLLKNKRKRTLKCHCEGLEKKSRLQR